MGKPRYVGVAMEDCYGANLAPYDFIDVVTESVVGEQGTIYPETAGVGRSLRQAIPGPWSEGGDIELIVGPENIEYILMAATGFSQYDESDGAYKHTFWPHQTIPSLTLEIAPEVEDKARRIPMAGISSLAFEATAREALTATATVVAQKEKIVDQTTPTFSTKRPFVFYDGTLLLDAGPIARCEAWSGTYENTIADDAYVLGTRFLPTLIVAGCNFTGDMDIQFLDWQWYSKYLGGGTEPGKTLSSVAMILRFISPETTGSSTAGWEYHKLEITLPEVYLNTSEASFDRRERIIQSCDWQAIYNSSAGYMCKIELINSREVTFANKGQLSSKIVIGT